jgi:hypothetical protein
MAGQVSAVMACLAAHSEVLAGELPAGLLGLRLRSVQLLNGLGDTTGLAVLAAESLAGSMRGGSAGPSARANGRASCRPRRRTTPPAAARLVSGRSPTRARPKRLDPDPPPPRRAP